MSKMPPCVIVGLCLLVFFIGAIVADVLWPEDNEDVTGCQAQAFTGLNISNAEKKMLEKSCILGESNVNFSEKDLNGVNLGATGYVVILVLQYSDDINMTLRMRPYIPTEVYGKQAYAWYNSTNNTVYFVLYDVRSNGLWYNTSKSMNTSFNEIRNTAFK